MFSLTDYDYKLPEAFIAQRPVERRDRSRMLFLDQKTGRISHHGFYELRDFLLPSDVLVINNTEVIPGRFYGRKETGGKVEVLILDYARGTRNRTKTSELVFECLIRASRRPRIGSLIFFEQGLSAEIIEHREEVYIVKFISSGEFESTLYRIGHVPLPPYIRRNRTDSNETDRTAYQTLYVSQKGAVAAPTAGLHFSNKLLQKLKQKKITIVEITLHVGYGTFLPVRVSDIRQHRIHYERYHVSKAAAEVINCSKAGGSRIVAVGTTCVRTLEFAADDKGKVAAGTGSCDLFIYPGYRFKIIDAMITNFHLPKSTLLMLVSAFAGREKILDAYDEAIREGYRFSAKGMGRWMDYCF